METNNSPEPKKHTTKAVTTEPQEEFIDTKGRPSRDQTESRAGKASANEQETPQPKR